MADQASQPTESVAGENGTFVASVDVEAHDPAPDIAVPQLANDDLLGELARAMHVAATSQYQRMNAELERRRADQVDQIGARASDEVDRLKAGSESDIAAIDAWAKAETETIKLERLRRIDTRRERLAGELERQASIREREIAAIEAAIDAHHGDVDRFFGRLDRETDPAAIARVASTMPAFPPLAEIAETARREAATELTSFAPEPGQSSGGGPAGPASAADPVVIPIEADSDARISESRLMAVMAPPSPQADTEDPQPWEAPHAVTVAARGSGAEGAGSSAPETPSRKGSTLLRTVRAIRPMSGERHDGGDR